MKWSNFYDRESNNKTFATTRNLVTSSQNHELARAWCWLHAYHLRSCVCRCCDIEVATAVSKHLRSTDLGSEWWSTSANSGMALLLDSPYQHQSIALCSYWSHDRDCYSGLLDLWHLYQPDVYRWHLPVTGHLVNGWRFWRTLYARSKYGYRDCLSLCDSLCRITLPLCRPLLWVWSMAHFQVGASGLPGFRFFSAKQEADMRERLIRRWRSSKYHCF